MPTTRVYFEEGTTSVFAAALEWPGWCRRAKNRDLALEALLDYQERYARIVTTRFTPGRLEVIGSVKGNATTDFGAPGVRGPWDDEAFTVKDVKRHVGLLQDCWTSFDAVVEFSSAVLTKGPRGGGRDRDDIARHVQEAERVYCSKLGTRVAPRTPWLDQRALVTQTLLAGAPDASWPSRYSIRRMAWHVLDHLWEIEDKRR